MLTIYWRPWSGVLEASEDGYACVQPPDFIAPEMTSEDCLTLNIFTTNLTAINRPVMLWIHGGGFTLGSKNLYRMRGLIEEDVILVTINYRLHALGFLSFGNDVVSGNMGLRDQQLAIRWVRENIREVGGDPNKITIFGESAGAMSVQAQLLSPLNTGLLAGAIAQSGSILFLNSMEQSSVSSAVRTAAALGCPTDLDSRTLECLQRVDIKADLGKISDNETALLIDPSSSQMFPFYPVVDSFSSSPFLPLDPLTALVTGRFSPVPYISGFVKNEGALVSLAVKYSGKSGQEILRVVQQTGHHLPYSILATDERLRRMATRFYNHTAGDTEIEQERPAMDLVTDSWFGTYDQKSVELMSRFSKHVYNFYLTQQTNNSVFSPGEELVGYTPSHGDDLVFIVNEKTVEEADSLSEEERRTARHMIRYWTNFAKYGEPSPVGRSEAPTWYPVTPTSRHYMELKAEPESRQDLLSDRMYFWEKMVWQSKQSQVVNNQLFHRTTKFLLDNNVNILFD